MIGHRSVTRCCHRHPYLDEATDVWRTSVLAGPRSRYHVHFGFEPEPGYRLCGQGQRQCYLASNLPQLHVGECQHHERQPRRHAQRPSLLSVATLTVGQETGQTEQSLTFGPNAYPTPLVTDTEIYQGAANWSITASDRMNLSIQWTTALPGTRDEISSLTVNGLDLYVATGRTVFALNRINGHILWHSTVPGSPKARINSINRW